MSNKKQSYKSLLSILATNCPDGCKVILNKYNGEPCVTNNPKELEMKLGRMYALSSNKLDIEKDFANIHPHKDFILKNKPVSKVEQEIPNIVAESDIKKEPIIIEQPIAQQEVVSTACQCKSCSKEPFSSADGITESGNNQSLQRPSDNSLVILSIFGIVAIFGMVLYAKK
jgi:hypothetical protein